MEYLSLSPQIQERIKQDLGISVCDGEIRRDPSHDKPNLWRPAYVRDCEKILHCPYYNRYTDKTQVFSLYKNDDITRRALHVQLVSRIARNISRLLGLNTDLTEAIAIGHDIGHTPFGHAGEKYLNELYYADTGRVFRHNIHSVRVLDKIFKYNISLQTLNGILCHDGENECREYKPLPMTNFDEFDSLVEKCYTVKDYAKTVMPSTLEGCVVRISDMIAYIGKDRQDAVRTGVIADESIYEDTVLGTFNSKIINNMIVNIVENSYGKNSIVLSDEYFKALIKAKSENYRLIYLSEEVANLQENSIKPVFYKVYAQVLKDVKNLNKNSFVYKHHIATVKKWSVFYNNDDYLNNDPHQIAVDYIASMTDSYLTELYGEMFPKDKMPQYRGYFE